MQFLGYIARNRTVFLRLGRSTDVLFAQTRGSDHGSNHAQMASITRHLLHLVHGTYYPTGEVKLKTAFKKN